MTGTGKVGYSGWLVVTSTIVIMIMADTEYTFWIPASASASLSGKCLRSLQVLVIKVHLHGLPAAGRSESQSEAARPQAEPLAP